MADRRRRRPVRGRVGCDRGRSDHRNICRIDGRGPDHQRDPDRTACRHLFRCSPQRRTGSVASVADHMARTSKIVAAAQDAADMRRRMGAAALELDAASDGSAHTRWRATVAARLPSQHWPKQTVLITAVDARTGEPVVFDRHSGVDLVDAVAASCSSGVRLPNRRRPLHRRRLPSQRRECRSGSRIRTGARTVTVRRQITRSGGLGHASRSTGRRTTSGGQQSRDDLPGQRHRAHIRRQRDGSVAASACCSSRLRPGQGPWPTGSCEFWR